MTSHSESQQYQQTSIGSRLSAVLPGLVLVAVVTAASYGIIQVPIFSQISPMIAAIFLGVIFSNITTCPGPTRPGMAIAAKSLLRISVVLLGLQLTLVQVWQIGIPGMLAITAIVFATFWITLKVARLMNMDSGIATLIACGTSVCGASAIAAASALKRSDNEDVTYAISTVSLLGTAAILIYPLLAEPMGLTMMEYGFWVGSSVHEVGQVVAAGYQLGEVAGEYSVLVKLARVLLLAPVLLIFMRPDVDPARPTSNLSFLSRSVPLFIVGFFATMILNTFSLVPELLHAALIDVTPIMLTAALGAIGLSAQCDVLRSRGIKPFLLGIVSWIVAALLAIVFMVCGNIAGIGP